MNDLRKSNGRIAWFLAGQAVSLFGSMMVQYAISWHLAFDSNSGMIYAISILCGLGPQLIISLISGVWADRYNRKQLIMLSDGGIALSTLVLIALIRGGASGYAPFLVVLAVRSLGQGIQTPAVGALIPQITEEDRLMRVNSVNAMIQSFVMLLSPIAGAMLYGSQPLHVVLMVDVVTAAMGISILALIRIPKHEVKVQAHPEGLFGEFKDGLRYLMGHFFVKRLSVYYILCSILLVPAASFNVLFLRRAYESAYMDIHSLAVLGQQLQQRLFDPQAGYTSLFLMSNEVAFFLGSIVGGVLLASWGGFKNRLVTLALGCVIFGLSTAAMGFAPAFLTYLVLILVSGLSMPAFNTPVMTLLQEKVDLDMFGRVFSLIQLAPQLVMMLASLVIGMVSDRIGLGEIMIVFGALMALGGVGILFDKRFMKEGFAPRPAHAEPEPGAN